MTGKCHENLQMSNYFLVFCSGDACLLRNILFRQQNLRQLRTGNSLNKQYSNKYVMDKPWTSTADNEKISASNQSNVYELFVVYDCDIQ